MFSLFDYEQIFNAYEREIRKKERQEGIQEGIQKETQKIAYNMFKNNSSDEYILDFLEISPKELNRLKAEYNQI